MVLKLYVFTREFNINSKYNSWTVPIVDDNMLSERAFLSVINGESVLKKKNNSHLLELLLLHRERMLS